VTAPLDPMAALWEAIGQYGAEVATSGCLAPPEYLTTAIAALARPSEARVVVTEEMVDAAVAYDASTWPSNPPEWSEKAKADGRAYYRGLLTAAINAGAGQ